MNRRVRGLVLACAAAAALGCKANGDDAKASKAKEAARPPVAVEVEPAASREWVEGVDVVGTLAPKFEAEVKSELPGAVAEVYVTQWVAVTRGQALARMDARELEAQLERARAAVAQARAADEQARAGVLEAQAAKNRAEREHERQGKLKEVGLATQQALDDALTQKQAAEARVAAAQAQTSVARAQIAAAEEDVRQLQTRLAKAVLRAPLDGKVSERSVNVGDLVGDRVAFRVVDNRLLDLTVSVPSRDMGRLRVGQPLEFVTDALAGETFIGKVMFINPSVDPADRSVKVTAEVRNGDGRLKGGLFVKGRIVTGRRASVLQVPRSALFAWDVAAHKGELFVVEGTTARRLSVTTGTAAGEFVEVASGLTPNQPVVVRGGFNLKDGDRVFVASGERPAAPQAAGRN